MQAKSAGQMSMRMQKHSCSVRKFHFFAGPSSLHSRRLYSDLPLERGVQWDATSSNGFAMSPGVGLDWNFTHHLGLRLGQVDYLFQRVPTSTNQVNWNNFRYFRWGCFSILDFPHERIFSSGAAGGGAMPRSRKGRSTEFLRPSSLSGNRNPIGSIEKLP